MLLLSNNHEKSQTLPEGIEQRNFLCFFAYSYVLRIDDDETRKVAKRNEYETDKLDSKCGYAHLVDYENHREYIWDGHKERTIEIGPSDETEKRLIRALIYLNSKEAEKFQHNICNQYDYAWIYKAINNKLFIGSDKFSFKYVSDYVKYIKTIVSEYGLKVDIGDSDNINMYLKKVDGTTLPWKFNDHPGMTEKKRRNDLANAFVFWMNPLMN